MIKLERRNQAIISPRRFRHRLLRNAGLAAVLVAAADGIGILGYHFIAELGWTDAFLNASMILSGMGPVSELHGNAAKIFAGFYALFSGVAFITSIGVLFIPILHRILHRFHLADESDSERPHNKK